MATYPINDDLDYNEMIDYVEKYKPFIKEVAETSFITEFEDTFVLNYNTKTSIEEATEYAIERSAMELSPPSKNFKDFLNETVKESKPLGTIDTSDPVQFSHLESIKMLFGKDTRENIVNIVTYVQSDGESEVKEVPVMVSNRSLITVTSDSLLKDAISHINNYEYLAYDIESNGLDTVDGIMIGFSFCGKIGEAYYIPYISWNKTSQTLEEVLSFDKVKSTLELLKSKKLLTWNGSFDIRFTKSNFGIDLAQNIFADGMLMKHTLQEEGDFSLKGNAILFQKEIGLDVESEANKEQIEIKENVIANGGVLNKTNYELYKADLEVMGKYAAADADLTLRLCTYFNQKLEEEGLDEFFYEKEVMPLYREAVIPMEMNGVKLDMDLINKTDEAIKKDIILLEKKVVDALYALPEVLQWEEDKAVELFPESTKGKFATKVLSNNKLEIDRTKSGGFSFTAKSIEKMPDSFIKDYLLNKNPLEKKYSLSISKELYNEYESLNISSKKQMGEIAFDYLKLKAIGKTPKGSPQFDEDFIQHLADTYGFEWATALSNYNKLIKIKGTYIDRFLQAQKNGYYYFSYKQHGTISGRLSGDAQQLPRPKEEGEVDELVRKYTNEIRAFFIAGDDRVFIDCDYESLEPHIFAHVSGDEGLRDIFRKGYDFYSTIAIATENLTEVSADKKADNYLGKVNKQVRQKSKAYSLGVPYGMTDFALGKTLDVSTETAAELIKGYLNGFPELKKWMKRSEDQVHREGFIRTEAGRVRHLPRAKELYKTHSNKLMDYRYRNSIKSKYGSEEVLKMYRDYKNSVNNAKNVQIQSLGASIINNACVAITREFKRLGLDAWLCAQIHDQAIFNVPEDKVEECKALIKDLMENTTKISIDLKAPPAAADNWRDSH